MAHNTEAYIYDSYNENSLIPTSYIRDYGDVNPFVEAPLPHQNYTTYDLFTLKTRLTPYLSSILSNINGWYIKFMTQPSTEGMRVYLHILDNKSVRGAMLTPDQKNKILDAINTDDNSFKSYCLIFDPDMVDLSSYHINRSWIRTIIPYLKITSKIKYDYNNNPLNIDDINISIIRMGYKIYGNLENSPNYIQHWAQLQQDILKRLYYLFNIGAIVIDTSICMHNIISKWKLKPLYNNVPEYETKEDITIELGDQNIKSTLTYVDSIHMENSDRPLPSTHIKGIYVPDWYDTRLSPISEFMNRVMFGDRTLKLTIEEKLTAYHSIAKKLNAKEIIFSFVRGMIIVNVDNYLQTVSCLDDICDALSNQPDTVIQLDPNEPVYFNAIDKAHKLGFKDTEIYYLIPYGHIISIGLTINHDQNEVYRLLREE